MRSAALACKGESLAERPARLRVIDGGGVQSEGRKPQRRTSISGKSDTEQLHVCSHCDVSALVRLRLGARDENGKLKGGTDHWCCARCFRPYYLIRSYD